MKRIWTIITSATVLIAMTLTFTFAPTDFVIRTPGPTLELLNPDQPLVQVGVGLGRDSTGQILATSMTMTDENTKVGLGSVIHSYLSLSDDVLPRNAVFSSGKTSSDTIESNRTAIESSREQAIAAGVRQAGIEVIELPKVISVRQAGPAYQLLFPDDFILEIDNNAMTNENEVREYIRTKHVGDPVVLTIIRGDQKMTVPIAKLAGSSSDGTVPTIGVILGTGYRWGKSLGNGDWQYDPAVKLNMDIAQGDVDQGLALALATYDLLTTTDNTADEIVAAAGKINAAGEISYVSGINEHIASAFRAHATLMFVPRANCADMVDQFPEMTIAPVGTLAEAAQVLDERPKKVNPPVC